MSLAKHWLSLIVSFLPLLCSGQTPASAHPQPNQISLSQPAQLVQSGVRSTANGDRIPLWSVMIGDTSEAEHRGHQFQWLGPYGLDATLWTRDSQLEESWIRSTFRRPRNLDEALDWHDNADAFTSRQTGNASLLPAVFAAMPKQLLARVEFVIAYSDGTAKAYLYAGTLQAEGGDMVREINKASGDLVIR